jgi:DNA-binding beta-propeller fold protein YncE
MSSVRTTRVAVVTACLLLMALMLAMPAFGKKKKIDTAPAQPKTREATWENFDLSKIVFPQPPAIARIRLLDRYIGENIERDVKKSKPKESWMDRVVGETPIEERKNLKIPYQLIAPYGLAVDSTGLVYAADQRVGAIFIYNPETRGTQLIRNGVEAHFGLLNGIALDDNDRLFVSDGKLKRVTVFSPQQHKVEEYISEGMVHPVGLAVDTENRLLYVVDVDLDQVLVYDADTYKLLRKIGTTGHNHELTSRGNFSKPLFVAVDQEGDVYVTDMMNNRVEIFDSKGKFVREFGKACDAPGCFQRPRGIAIDGDGHVWVTDGVSDLVQVFSPDGHLLTYFGSYGKLPGQFSSLAGIAIDKRNRVFVGEQQPGRIQMFRYVTDVEAEVERKRRIAEREKKFGRPVEMPASGVPTEKPTATPVAAPSAAGSAVQQ